METDEWKYVVYIYECTYAYICICILNVYHICMYIPMYIYTYTHTYIHIYIYIYNEDR